MADLDRLRQQLFAAIALAGCSSGGGDERPDKRDRERDRGRETERVVDDRDDEPRTPVPRPHHLGAAATASSMDDLPRTTYEVKGVTTTDCIVGEWCAVPGHATIATRAMSGVAYDHRGCPDWLPRVPWPFGGSGDVEAKAGVRLSAGRSTSYAFVRVASGAKEECCYRWAYDCNYSESGSIGVEGRAYRDGDALAVAGVAERGLARATAAIAALPTGVREAFARHWLATALAEHASIAAFARATLELMSLGAPLELIGAMQAAAGDEVRHAREAFALASEYAGRALHPTALRPLAPRPVGLVEAAVDTYLEGCVGEMFNAARAAEAARTCELPHVGAVLATVAEDEARHAALAWSTLAWLVTSAGAPARDAVLAAAAGVAPLAPPRDLADAATLRRHGLLPAAAAVALDREVRRTILAPALARLAVRDRVHA